MLPFPLVYKLKILFLNFYSVTLTLHCITCISNIVYTEDLATSYENYSQFYYTNIDRYNHLILRAAETVTSVGYGEFPVKSLNGKIFCIHTMILTSGLLGIVVGSIQSALEKSNQVNNFFRELFRKTSFYCKEKCIPKHLREKINSFLRNLRLMYEKNLIEEEDLVNLLSGPLKQEIFTLIRGHALLKLDELKKYSSGCLRATGYMLENKYYGSGDLIINQDELENSLFFIVSGDIDIFHKNTRTLFKVLSKNTYFGEIAFFSNSKRTTSAISENFSELLRLKRADFLTILQTFPKDKAIFESLEKDIKQFGLSALGTRCYLCNTIGHISINCESSIVEKE